MTVATHEIRIETSTICNYDCVMCARDTFQRRRALMSNAFFEEVVARAARELPQLRVCTVSGFGELALDPGWRHKLAVAARAFETVHVVTNLSRIAGDDLDHLAATASEIRVSVYGLDDATYRAVHRPPRRVSPARIFERIEYLAGLPDRPQRPRPRVSVSCCALEANEHQIEEWIARWTGVVDDVEVWRPHNWVNGHTFRSLAEGRAATCGRPASGPIQVQVDGTVNVCCFDYNGELLVGDLRTQSFAEIFAGPRMTAIREQHASGRADELALCRRCDQRAPAAAKAAALIYSSRAPAAARVRLTSSGMEELATSAAQER